MEKYNISKPEKYIKDGVEKTFWQNVGTMTKFTKKDGTTSTIIEIPAIGLKANVFPFTSKAEKTDLINEDHTAIDPMTGVDLNDGEIPF
jgi:hypothetical protein